MNIGSLLNFNGLSGVESGAVSAESLSRSLGGKEIPSGDMSSFNNALKSEVRQESHGKSSKDGKTAVAEADEKESAGEKIKERPEHPLQNRMRERIPPGLIRTESTPATPKAYGIFGRHAETNAGGENSLETTGDKVILPESGIVVSEQVVEQQEPQIPNGSESQSEENPLGDGAQSQETPVDGSASVAEPEPVVAVPANPVPVVESKLPETEKPVENIPQTAEEPVQDLEQFVEQPAETESAPELPVVKEYPVDQQVNVEYPENEAGENQDPEVPVIVDNQIPDTPEKENLQDTNTDPVIPEQETQNTGQQEATEFTDGLQQGSVSSAPELSDVSQVRVPPVAVQEEKVLNPFTESGSKEDARHEQFGHRIRDFVHAKKDELREMKATGEKVNEKLGHAVREVARENGFRSERTVPEYPRTSGSLPETDKPKVPVSKEALSRAKVRNDSARISNAIDKPVFRNEQSVIRNATGVGEKPVAAEQPDTQAYPERIRNLRTHRMRHQARMASQDQATQTKDVASQKPTPFGQTVSELAHDNTAKSGLGSVVAEMAREKNQKAKRAQDKERAEAISSKAQRAGSSESSSSVNRTSSTSRVVSTQEAFMKVISAVERMQSAGDNNRMQLRLQFENGDKMRVFLKYSKGLLHTVFMTESDGLRTAMRDGWDNFQRQLLDQGVETDKPDFHNGHHDQGTGREHPDFQDELLFGGLGINDRVELNKGTETASQTTTQSVADTSRNILNTYA